VTGINLCCRDVDPTRVLDYARQNLGDFEAYLKAISEIVSQPI
jgi:hypothetical protein